MEKLKGKILRFLLGERLDDADLTSEKFSVLWGIPVFASDAISSVSYAGEEILLVLIPVLSLMSYKYFLPIVLAIIGLLAILVFCYSQTINAYPNGGGAYIVSSENLGDKVGLVAGSSLIMGYILTVAVSSCASAAAITSAFPSLYSHKALIAFLIITIITWGNLRGMHDSAVLFGIPTYLFIITMIVMLATGTTKYLTGNITPQDVAATGEVMTDTAFFLILRAFASGCTALTGVEAVSDGVPNFREPRQKKAKSVLIAMAGFVCLIFVGVSLLMKWYQIVPNEEATAVSQLAAAIFGRTNAMYYVVQIMTVVILALAANTAYADLPVLMSVISGRGYLPKKMAERGQRLSFSNGIVFLYLISSLLVFLFNGNQHHLLPLYASGVFISFTLSQMGMFMHWIKQRPQGWQYKAVINAVGTVVCAVVLTIIVIMKFTQGAWVSLLCIAALVRIMLKVKDHYKEVGEALKIKNTDEARNMIAQVKPGKCLIMVQSVSRSFVKMLDCAISCGFKDIELYMVCAKEEDAIRVMDEIREYHIEASGINVQYNYEVTTKRNINEMILKHVEASVETLEEHQTLTVLMGAVIPLNDAYMFLHNDKAGALARQLRKYRNVSVLQVNFLV